jgi:cullin-associated NEDD8-dissociated protein 1
LLPKLNDADSDIRYMTLNDLIQMFQNGSQSFIQHDYTTCAKVVEGLVGALSDTHGDVQNQAIKCLGPFVNKAPETILCPTIEKVSNIKKDGQLDTSIPALALRAIVVALPHPIPGMPRSQKVQEAYTAVSKALIPRLVGRIVIPLPKPGPAPPKGMLQDDLDTGNDSNSLDLLTEVAKCYGSMLQDAEVEALEQMTMQFIDNERCGTVMKKKAISALSALAPYFSDRLLARLVSNTIEQFRQSHLTNQQRKLYITVYGSLARSIPQKFGPYLKTLAPFVLAPLSQEELEQQREAEAEADGERDVQMEEVREAALITMEGFLEACAQDMRTYTKEVIESTTRFLKYEPNMADDDDEEMGEEEEEDEFAGDEDFEEETGFEDEDDVSWKVRRCSAKALHGLISMLDANDPALFGQIAPALINRFKEREESVRLEVISTLAYLITKTGSSTTVNRPETKSTVIQPSRKRRRGFSDSVGSDLQAQQTLINGQTSPPTTPPPADGAAKGLWTINPDVVKGSSKLLKSSTLPTKQALISLLKDMVIAQRGGLAESADLVIEPVIDTMNSTTGSVSNVAGNALRLESLALLRAIAETHSSKVIQPHLNKIIPALVKTANDRFAKVSGEAFSTIEAYIKALTPRRSAVSNSGDVVTKLYAVIVDRISAQDTDTEVKQKAVQALGLLIGRTSGSAAAGLLSEQDRFAGQQLIAERMKNELTRLACVRAVDTIAVLAQTKQDYKPNFVSAVALELGAQLRKASRSLRGASLSALRMLAVNQASRESMDDSVVSQLVDALVPLLVSEDLHMMGPALIVLAAFARDNPQLVGTEPVINGICSIVRSPLSGATLDALITSVESIGQAGAGSRLMTALLQLAPAGDTDVTGQVIGTLLVAGGDSVGVKLDAFVGELRTQSDETKRCLALTVLGEAGLRLGSDCALKPESFTRYFADESEKVKLAAAVALGRAGSGNVKGYLPNILDGMAQGKQYLLLHSVKELLQHSNAEDDIRPYTRKLWDNIIASGQAEDNKVVGAECVGRLAIIDPAAYLPQLQTFLQNSNPTIRGMVIAALRYVLSDTEDAYNSHLQATIIPLLSTMLNDTDLDNQRLSLATFNSALHNKPDLVLPHLGQLLPFAMQASVIRPELIREVSMGPFKHKIDDGLEIRKSAYETLYALLDSPASRQRVDMSVYYDRIIAGIADEHEIKILCCLVLQKLLTVAPAESARRLEALAPQFRTVLAFKPKDTAVKQELEKIAEHQKAVVKVSGQFNKAFGEGGEGGSRAWKEYYDWVKKDFANFLREE